MRLIDVDAIDIELAYKCDPVYYRNTFESGVRNALAVVFRTPTADSVEVREARYNAHEVAEIIADLFGDCCACNYNGIDEWLPLKCELIDACPNTVGVACWEQYLKHRDERGK